MEQQILHLEKVLCAYFSSQLNNWLFAIKILLWATSLLFKQCTILNFLKYRPTLDYGCWTKRLITVKRSEGPQVVVGVFELDFFDRTTTATGEDKQRAYPVSRAAGKSPFGPQGTCFDTPTSYFLHRNSYHTTAGLHQNSQLFDQLYQKPTICFKRSQGKNWFVRKSNLSLWCKTKHEAPFT